jgi:hypothetical protein
MKDTTIAEYFYVVRKFQLELAATVSMIGSSHEFLMRTVAGVSDVSEKERRRLQDCAELLRSSLTVLQDSVKTFEDSLPV